MQTSSSNALGITSDELLLSASLRAASLGIGAYEFICTIPLEYRLYRAQRLSRGISQRCLLFILIRYLSVTVIAVSNVGFFAQFSTASCHRFFLVSPIFKVIQTIMSQLILAVRTYSISKRARWVLWTTLGLFVVVIPLEFFANIFQRTVTPNHMTHNCTTGNQPSHRVAWINYAVAIIFDLVAICISTGYLWSYKSATARVSHFVEILLYEGLGYFVVLTAVNVFNLILYHSTNESTQSSGVSLGYAVIFIMSQRILLTQRGNAEEQRSLATQTSIDITQSLDTSHAINNALRSQFESPKTSFLEPTASAIHSLRHHRLETLHEDVEVQVRVERTIIIEHDSSMPQMENYRKPRVSWDPRV